jgi:lipopolysaccharide/colanic/teichoic acid biosynthesis glycosyltransferase
MNLNHPSIAKIGSTNLPQQRSPMSILQSEKTSWSSIQPNDKNMEATTQTPMITTKTLDEKTARMVEVYANQSFKSSRAIQRMRLQLLTWVIRSKIIEGLRRAFDFTVACVALFFLWPVMAFTALAIKMDSPGPVLFKQKRVGKWGSTFLCFKFRSMYIDAEARKTELLAQNEVGGDVMFKMKDDPRVTRVGRLIRKLSIDELPQLLNVVRGEMRLVGPRPPVPSEVAQYEFDQRRRLNAIPGITGLPQISGRSNLSFTRWVELDLKYIEEQSLLKDVEILLKTIPAVVFSRGAY